MIAGADPFEGDRLVRFALTLDGLCTRDRLVLASGHARGVPVATVMSGGCAFDINDTVEIHCNTIREAKKLSGVVPFCRDK